jgi:hypothetical protein
LALLHSGEALGQLGFAFSGAELGEIGYNLGTMAVNWFFDKK